MLKNYRNLQIWNTSVFSPSVSPNFFTLLLDFCVFVFVSPECPPLYYFAREHWWYCITVFLRTDWLNVSLLLFQIWYLANWIFRSVFPKTQGAVTHFNPYEFLTIFDMFFLICSLFNKKGSWTGLEIYKVIIIITIIIIIIIIIKQLSLCSWT